MHSSGGRDFVTCKRAATGAAGFSRPYPGVATLLSRRLNRFLKGTSQHPHRSDIRDTDFRFRFSYYRLTVAFRPNRSQCEESHSRTQENLTYMIFIENLLLHKRPQ